MADSFSDLQSYIRFLEQQGELKRVRVEVDPELEITEIATRVVREKGPALLFERVKGSDFPLAINLFGSERRIELALGRHPGEIGQWLLKLAENLNPPTVKGIWSQRSALLKLLNMRVGGARGRAPSQEVSEEPDLDRLPVLKCWPQDGGRFFTFPWCSPPILSMAAGTLASIGCSSSIPHYRDALADPEGRAVPLLAG